MAIREIREYRHAAPQRTIHKVPRVPLGLQCIAHASKGGRSLAFESDALLLGLFDSCVEFLEFANARQAPQFLLPLCLLVRSPQLAITQFS